MKKIIALLITFGTVTAAFAQSEKIDEARRIINGEQIKEQKVYKASDSRYPSRNTTTYKKHKKYKKDNGKHLGWQKGVGNPHKAGYKKSQVYKKGKKK